VEWLRAKRLVASERLVLLALFRGRLTNGFSEGLGFRLGRWVRSRRRQGRGRHVILVRRIWFARVG
jgi:hypothetical protein